MDREAETVDIGERSYAILGTGAVGGYYGARLYHAGFTVHFLLHSDYTHVREHGLTVESKEGEFSVSAPLIYRNARDLPRCDVVLVSLKTTQNKLLADMLPPVVTSNGAVVMMQNGLGVEADAATVLPEHDILGGLAFLCSNKVGPGHICHLDYGAVRLGQYSFDGEPAGKTAALRVVAADLRLAGIPVEIEEDLVLARWMKLVWNIPFNGLCVVHGCTTDALMADRAKRSLCESIMREVVVAAAACGRRIDPSFVQIMLAATEEMAAYKPSMKLDHERHQRLEIEAIYGNPLRAARAAGAECPLIEELYETLTQMNPGGAGVE